MRHRLLALPLALLLSAAAADAGQILKYSEEGTRKGKPYRSAVTLSAAPEGDPREDFNTHALDQGFPVREFRSKGGVVEVDSVLVSVETADLSPDLFLAPAPVPQAAAAKGPAPDHSLSVAAWIERGMPAPDRAWVMADYERAVEVLKPVAKEDATRLPRRESAVSGDVFHRFVDPGNLTLGRSVTMDAQMRLQTDAGVMVGVGKLTLLYAGAYKGGLSFDEELVELMVYTLLVSREVIPLADDIVAKIPRDAPDRAVRLEGRDKMSAGLATIVSGCLDSLGAADGFRPAERLRLARALQEHLPALRPHMPAGARQELGVRLRRMAEAETDPAVKEVLERVHAGLPKAHSKPA